MHDESFSESERCDGPVDRHLSQGSGSDGESEDAEVVGAALSGGEAPISMEMLFRGQRRRSTSSETSLLSSRTLRRWAMTRPAAAAAAVLEGGGINGGGRRMSTSFLPENRQCGVGAAAVAHGPHPTSQGPCSQAAVAAESAPPPPRACEAPVHDCPAPPSPGPPLPGRATQQRSQPLRNGNWTNAQLQGALRAHERGISVNGAATLFDIPRTTFRAHLTGTILSRKRGATPVLTTSEEDELVQYVLNMQNLGFPLSLTQLKLQVAMMTQSRETPFTNGIPGPGWLRWFRRRHPELSLRLAQGLDVKRARGLCPENVKSFYENLSCLYDTHNYSPSRIWNCDESGVQAGRNGGAYVLAKVGSRNVHQVVPDEREWLTVLTCINAAGESIPNFYIFRGKRFRRNYIQFCEQGATMAMSRKAWMTAYLFSAWIDHFIQALQNQSTVSVSSPHLLILDGHSSHVTVDVVKRARAVGLHLLTLPSHCSHAMQPLDVAVFKPFKGAFRVYRDAWTLQNRGRGARKEVLASWTSKALTRALTVANIQAGFRRTGIYPLNPAAMDSSMMPSTAYSEVPPGEETSEILEEDIGEGNPSVTVEEVLLEAPPLPCPELQYVVHLADSEGEGEDFRSSQESDQPAVGAWDLGHAAEQGGTAGGLGHGAAGHEGAAGELPGLLTLPTVPVRRSRLASAEPLVDYSKSILLTSDAYLSQMENISAKRTNAAIAKDARKAANEERKRKREDERVSQNQRKKEREEEKAEKAREKAYWAQVAERGWGNDLQARMKSSLPPPPGSYRGVYVGTVPTWCITNQRRRRMLLDLRKAGASNGGARPAETEVMRVTANWSLHGPAAISAGTIQSNHVLGPSQHTLLAREATAELQFPAGPSQFPPAGGPRRPTPASQFL